MKIAISDIHGCIKTFKALLSKLGFSKNDTLFLLGDYIDRGPDSKGVIDYIWELQSENYDVRCLRGNHDQMMLDALFSMKWQRTWLHNGGWTTIESFDAKLLSEIPIQYFNFFKEMPYYFEEDEYLLVHAGLNFMEDDPLSDKEAMLWERNWDHKIDKEWLGNRIIIHGHTPIKKFKIEHSLLTLEETPVINIDNGCVYDRGELNNLCAFDMTNRKLYFQANVD